MLKNQPTLHDQYAWALRDSKNSHLAYESMLSQFEKNEVTIQDMRPFFEMCQRKDQQLLDIEATIRREHIRTMDAAPVPPEPLGIEINRQNALSYLLAQQKQAS